MGVRRAAAHQVLILAGGGSDADDRGSRLLPPVIAGVARANLRTGALTEDIAMRAIAAVVLLLVAAFCVYGFIAAGEPGPNHIYYRIGYPLVGILCLAAAAAMLTRKKV